MRGRNGSLFAAVVLLISDIVLLEAAFMVIGSAGGDDTLGIGFLPWSVLAVAEFSLYRLFIRRERSLPKAAGFLALSYAVTVAVLLIFFVSLPGFLATVIAMFFWALPQYRIYTTAVASPTVEKLSSRLDGIIVVSLVVLVYIVGTDRPLIYVLPCTMSVLLCLAALIVTRACRGDGHQGRRMRATAVMLAFLLMISAAVAAFLLFVSASFTDVVSAGAAALLDGLKYLFNLIMRFFEWLASLIPEPGYGGGSSYEMIQEPGATGEMEGFVEAGPNVMIIIVCALAAVIAIGLIIAVVHLRRKNIGGKRIHTAPSVKQRRLRSRVSCLRRFINALKFFGYSILFRNTPQGVFVRIERWGRFRRRGRELGETPRNYLLRVSENVPEQKTALQGLADALDARWYGDPKQSQQPRRALAKLRRAFTIARPL